MALGFALMGWSIGPAFGPFMGGNLLEFLLARRLCHQPGHEWAWLCPRLVMAPNLRRPEPRRLDYYGSITIIVAVSTLLLALTQGNREGWDSQYILTLFGIAGVAGVAFVVVELCHPEPLVELRLFSSVPFIMALVVLFLTTMTFRGTGPMTSVLMQRLLGFEPMLVAWTQMAPNLIYGAAVLLVGRLSDRLPTYVLVISGLLIYIVAFWGYAGVSEVTTFAMMMAFLMIRFIAEALIVSPNSLATLEALPENKVYMATALSGLLRSIANTMGTAIATVVWDQRYSHRLLQYAETPPGYLGVHDSAGQACSRPCSGPGSPWRKSPARPWPCCRTGCWPKPARQPGRTTFCSMPCWLPCVFFQPCPSGGDRSMVGFGHSPGSGCPSLPCRNQQCHPGIRDLTPRYMPPITPARLKDWGHTQG